MSPEKLAYLIREAIYASRFHEDLRHYAEIWPFYQLKVGKDHVMAYWTGIGPMPGEGEVMASVIKLETSIMDRVEVLGSHEFLDVIGTLINAGEATELYFPHTKLEPDAMVQLYEWCTGRGWRMIDHADEGMTVTKKSVDPEIEWRP